VGILGVAALRHQRLGMIGVGDVAVALIGADMAGDQVLVQAQMLRIGLERELGAGEAGRHGVAVAFEGHPKLPIGAHRQDPRDIESARIDRLQVRALLGPQIHRPALGLAVQADIGHRLQPEAHRRIEGGEVGQLLGVEEVAFHIAHGPLHPPFLVALGEVAGDDLKVVVPGEIEIAGIEPGRLAAHVGEHRRAQVIDHHPPGDTQGVEGIDVGGEEVLHALGQGEFHIELAAVGQHHDEE
jgi:hypothetical protein